MATPVTEIVLVNALFTAALELQQFLVKRDWKFCLIGGLAVVRWGQPRATQDVDVSLLADFGSEAEYVDPILDVFEGRLDDAREFALANRVVLVRSSNDVPLDIALAGFPFEEKVIERASSFVYAPGVELLTASAEDIVVMKAFAGRHQDWSDVEGIATRQGDGLDWQDIICGAQSLLDVAENSDMVRQLQKIRQDTLGN
jgi:hypothetical protein